MEDICYALVHKMNRRRCWWKPINHTDLKKTLPTHFQDKKIFIKALKILQRENIIIVKQSNRDKARYKLNLHEKTKIEIILNRGYF